MRNVYRIRARVVLYFGICLVPLPFILMMIGGALENVSIIGLNIGASFVVLGALFLGLILLSAIAAPCVTLVITQREEMLVSEVRFLCLPVRTSVFNSKSLHVSSERRGVFASETLATHETIQLKSISENGVERTVVGDLGRIFFGVDCLKILKAYEC